MSNVGHFVSSVSPIWSSYKELMVNDLARVGDEGRGKQRYASGSRKQVLIRRSPNGGTRPE